MRFTVIIEDRDAARIARRTFDAGETLGRLDEALAGVRDFLEAFDTDPQAALDDGAGEE